MAPFHGQYQLYNNIRNGAIPWLVSAFIKVVLEHFTLALIIFQILYTYIFRYLVTLKIEVKVTMYNIRNVFIFWRISASIMVILAIFRLLALFVFQILYIYISRKFVTLEILVKVTMYKTSNGAIRWLVSTSIKIFLVHLYLALTVFQILMFIYFHIFFDLENVGQCHNIQHTPWGQSMENT